MCLPSLFNPSHPDSQGREKIIFTLFCGASKGFMKAFEAPGRSAKIKT